MAKYPKFVIRKIKNGKVQIYGKIYEPDTRWLEYDGRLDGLWYWFCLYLKSAETEQLENFVELHRIEKGQRDDDPDVVDGYLPWAFWHTKG